uniref:Reverse transcriptase domain-containing protein n=1 Tax=Tanacetum cinerariifolium TaxID=118510 RepID=A0A6L2NVZ4_TANCI|nr:reverse transcriptase domain-containing protein [Tanacetum cinerariifolium]
MLRACPHHVFSELTQIDTFYNGLNEQDQDSLNAAAGGNLLSKTTREALKIIENKSTVCYSRSKSNVSRVNTNSRESTSKTDDKIDKLADQISNLVEIVNNFFQNQASTSRTLSSNTIANPKGEMKAVTTRSGLAYEGPSIPTNFSLEKVVEQETEETTDKEQTNYQGSTAHIQPSVVPTPILKPDVSKTQPKPNIRYPSRLNDQKLREKATNQMEKFFQIFHDLHFNVSFENALLLMPKFGSTIKSLLTNKDKLFELAKVPFNENCLAMLLKKLPEKLGDPHKFFIPCDFPGMDVCQALADLGASINLMPLSIWKKLPLPELTPTRMTLKLADRSITRPKGVVEDVFVKVGKFHFPTDFVVVDFEADPRVSLILGRSFLRTGRALIDVYGEEITFGLMMNPGDILYLEKMLNDDPSQLPPMDFKQAEETKAKSSIEEPLELELKELPSHLEYAFLEETEKLPVIIAKDLKDVEKEALLKVLKSHKRVIAWKIIDIKDRPMTHLLEKETPFLFSNDCIDAFKTLKKKLTEALILVVPDWNLPFKLMCDASDFAIGKEKFHKEMKCLKMLFKFVKSSMYGVLILWDHSRLHEGIERTKKLHDSKIKNRIFNVGDQVLLFNYRLKIFSEKLKTRWSGPFTITQVFPYGTIELSQPDGPNFKVNGHRVKHYFRGDIPSKVVPDLHTIPMDK